jgi:hypothetical protein
VGGIVGWGDGRTVGLVVGHRVGFTVGFADGDIVGFGDGFAVGILPEGLADGFRVGFFKATGAAVFVGVVGFCVDPDVGPLLGVNPDVGLLLGIAEGVVEEASGGKICAPKVLALSKLGHCML